MCLLASAVDEMQKKQKNVLGEQNRQWSLTALDDSQLH